MDSRLTTKQDIVAVLGGTRAIAGKVTSASLDDIVFAVLAFGVLEGCVLVNLLEERC